VQTVRLADLLAHAMSNGATRADITTIAQHEAASYLDISAAQLDALWDELSSLHDRTLHHSRGGAEPDESTGDESATRVKSPLQHPAPIDVPRQFPCAQCGSPSFGDTCPACKGYACPKHPVGERDWCCVCDAEYPSFAQNQPTPLNAMRGTIAALAVVAASSAMGWFYGGPGGPVRGLISGLVVAALGTGSVVVAQRSSLRARFIRTRPDRSITLPGSTKPATSR
jgi:hypothetical protein